MSRSVVRWLPPQVNASTWPVRPKSTKGRRRPVLHLPRLGMFLTGGRWMPGSRASWGSRPTSPHGTVRPYSPPESGDVSSPRRSPAPHHQATVLPSPSPIPYTTTPNIPPRERSVAAVERGRRACRYHPCRGCTAKATTGA